MELRECRLCTFSCCTAGCKFYKKEHKELQIEIEKLRAENAKLTTKYWMAVEKISCNDFGSCSRITEMHCNECIDREIESEVNE